jgi:hypothetical protein
LKARSRPERVTPKGRKAEKEKAKAEINRRLGYLTRGWSCQCFSSTGRGCFALSVRRRGTSASNMIWAREVGAAQGTGYLEIAMEG